MLCLFLRNLQSVMYNKVSNLVVKSNSHRKLLFSLTRIAQFSASQQKQ